MGRHGEIVNLALLFAGRHVLKQLAVICDGHDDPTRRIGDQQAVGGGAYGRVILRHVFRGGQGGLRRVAAQRCAGDLDVIDGQIGV